MSKKIILAVTGASGTLYARRFLRHLPSRGYEVHVIVSEAARLVAEREGGLRLPVSIREWDVRDLTAPMSSGSRFFDAMVVMPCSAATLGKIAHGIADNLITRAGEVQLKERRRLILVTRETPLSLIQIRNMEVVTLAGALVLPANPSFYGGPQSVEELADTVVARVYDHMGIEASVATRWAGKSGGARKASIPRRAGKRISKRG
jgi:flavin prenyltransferase